MHLRVASILFTHSVFLCPFCLFDACLSGPLGVLGIRSWDLHLMGVCQCHQQKKNSEKCVQLRRLSKNEADKFIFNRTLAHTTISPHKALRELNAPAFNNLSAAVKIKTPYGDPDPVARTMLRTETGSRRTEPRRLNTRGSRCSVQDITQSQVSCRRHGFAK